MNVDWFITNNCDQAKFCRFCYAPWRVFPPDVSVEQALQICGRLIEVGVRTVTLCGGEPFHYPGLLAVVRKLAVGGIQVVLYTSTTSDRHDLKQLVPHLNFISLPIDAVTPSVVEQMRGANQFARVSAVLRELRALPARPNIKIGTVVTKQNIGDLRVIYEFLCAQEIIDVWRLYQFSPYGIGKRHQDLFEISEEAFRAAAAEMKKGHIHGFSISERSREENIGYCMIMDSGGSFYRYEEKYIPLGITIFDRIEEVAEQYNQKKHQLQKSWQQ